jgi:hypothetical protein
MRTLVLVLALLTTLFSGGCMQTIGDVTTSPFHEYTQRTDVITLSAGNAQDVNSRIQELDPWPSYVGNNRIVISGERIAGAVERDRDVTKLNQAPTPLPVEATQ